MANASEHDWDGPADTASGARARADALMALGRYAEALPLLGTLVAAEPGSARPRCLMAQAHLGLNRPREAFEQAEAAIGVDPGEEWGHRIRAFALLDLGRRKEALAGAREAVRLTPYRAESHAVLGEAQLACRDKAGAEATARRLVELAPSDVSGHDLHGRVAMTRARYREAEEHFREALRLDPENSAVLNNIGVALEGQGRQREAVHLFGQASAADPHDSTARRNAMSAARIGGVGIVFILARVPVTAWTHAWPPEPIVWSMVLGVAGLTAALYLALRGRRRHRYPEASPQLLRSLRRQATWRDRFHASWHRQHRGDAINHVPFGMHVFGVVSGFLLVAMSAVGLILPPTVSLIPASQWVLLIAIGLAYGGVSLHAIRRRRRA